MERQLIFQLNTLRSLGLKIKYSIVTFSIVGQPSMILVEVISLHWYKLICWACPHRSAFCNALCSLSVSHGNCPHFPIMVIFVQDDPDNLTIAHLGLSQISSATYSSILPSSSTFETGFLKKSLFPMF